MDANSYADTLLNHIIKEEIKKIEQGGEKVRLKSVFKKGFIAVIIGVFAFLFSALLRNIFFSIVFGLICFFMFLGNTKEEAIAKLAKKMPDKPIDEIIREDMI